MNNNDKSRRQHLQKSLVYIIAYIGIVAAVIAAVYAYRWYVATHTPVDVAVIAEEIILEDTDSPNETPIDLDSEYTVPADQPRRIDLPTAGISGFVQRVGTTSENRVAVPSNIYLAGWYVDSVLPGETGVSLIDGHSGGRFADGIFRKLDSLKTNDEFTVEFGDGRRTTFRVKSVESISINQINERFLQSVEGIDRQLNLITCSGSYDAKLKQFDQRVLVVSEAI